jgi:amino acid transporter
MEAPDGRPGAAAGSPRAGPSLLRALTTWDVVALGVNGVIGGGIFLAPATVARLAGSWSTAAYLFSGALVGLVALCFAELGGRFGRAGGPYLYASRAFGPRVGFQIGWFTWLARITSLASLANGFVAYAAYLAPAAGAGAARLGVLALLLGGLTALNVRGVAHGAWAIDLLTLVKLAALGAFAVAGAFHVEPARLVPGEPPGAESFLEAALFLIYVFSGFEVLTFPAEEMLDPRRSVPRAIVATMTVVSVAYLSVHLVAMGTLDDLAASPAPVAAAAGSFLGPAAGAAAALAALLSITGTKGGLMLTTPRLVYAMADGGQIPAAFARVHPRFRTPHVAIAVQGAVALALAAAGTFEELAKLSAIARIVSYLATAAAVPALRRKMGGDAPFRIPGGPAVPAAALILCATLVASSSAAHLALGAGAAAAGSALHALLAGWAGRPLSAESPPPRPGGS